MDRIHKILFICQGLVICTGLSMGGLAYLFGDRLLRIYSTDPQVIAYGLLRMSVICVTYAICGIMDVMVGSLRGLGYSVMPMFVSLIGACGLRIVWIFTYFQRHHTLFNLYISYPITWIITGSVHILCFCIIFNRIKKETI